MEFHFQVLWSVIVWGVYFSSSLVIGTFFFRKTCPNVFEFFKTGDCESNRDKDYDDDKIGYFEVSLAIIWFYIFWPIIITFMILAFIAKLFSKGFRNLIIFVDRNVPEISIKTKE